MLEGLVSAKRSTGVFLKGVVVFPSQIRYVNGSREYSCSVEPIERRKKNREHTPNT